MREVARPGVIVLAFADTRIVCHRGRQVTLLRMPQTARFGSCRMNWDDVCWKAKLDLAG